MNGNVLDRYNGSNAVRHSDQFQELPMENRPHSPYSCAARALRSKRQIPIKKRTCSNYRAVEPTTTDYFS